MTMSTRKIAPKTLQGRPIGPVGYGLMSLTLPWAPVEYDEAVNIMKTALNQGANLWNGGIHYGKPDANSLHLLRHYFQKYPEDAEKVVLSIKGCYSLAKGPEGSPEAVRASVGEALKVLDGVKKIDIFEMARVDPNTSIEVSVQALADQVKAGRIGGIGLSEVSAKSIRRAHAVNPIAAVEIELSLFTPNPLYNGIMDTCQELGIAVVAYSPVGRGWLTGKYRSVDDIPTDSFLHTLDRFKPENFEQNSKLVDAVERMAERKGLTTSQVAIAWVSHHGALPIPGSTNPDRVALNSKCVSLTDEDLRELQQVLDTFPVAGDRYGGVHEKLLNA